MSTKHRGARLLLASAAVLATTAATLAATSPVQAADSGASANYLVLMPAGTSSSTLESKVAQAGGSVVASYPQIGVAIARSTRADFATRARGLSGVQGASATAPYATTEGGLVQDGSDQVQAPTSTTWGDSLSSLQWDMRNINVPAAHQVTTGSGVTVGDLDTGLDFTHPDLVANYDAADSTDCTSGAPAPLGAFNDQAGHGTHTAGTIAAAANGTGIVGVAPGVKIAGIKAGNDAGYFFPEAVVCGFMWAGTHGIDVTNNSYFADPYYMNCKNDPTQRAIWQAESRAIAFAQSKGTVVVASEGNESNDLSHPDLDSLSPDDSTPVTRDVTNACGVVPVEVPGVIGVSATGVLHEKSFYSSYGISTVDVAAPGGDSILQKNADAVNGRVLSTWPSYLGCSRKVVQGTATYCYLQGTSMAGPHVAGLAALVLSAHPGMSPRAVESVLQSTATPLPCPPDSLYAGFPSALSGAPQHCTGNTGHNSFYGAGEVNAAAAVR